MEGTERNLKHRRCRTYFHSWRTPLPTPISIPSRFCKSLRENRKEEVERTHNKCEGRDEGPSTNGLPPSPCLSSPFRPPPSPIYRSLQGPTTGQPCSTRGVKVSMIQRSDEGGRTTRRSVSYGTHTGLVLSLVCITSSNSTVLRLRSSVSPLESSPVFSPHTLHQTDGHSFGLKTF